VIRTHPSVWFRSPSGPPGITQPAFMSVRIFVRRISFYTAETDDFLRSIFLLHARIRKLLSVLHYLYLFPLLLIRWPWVRAPPHPPVLLLVLHGPVSLPVFPRCPFFPCRPRGTKDNRWRRSKNLGGVRRVPICCKSGSLPSRMSNPSDERAPLLFRNAGVPPASVLDPSKYMGEIFVAIWGRWTC